MKDYEVKFILRNLIANLELIGTIEAMDEISFIENYLPKLLSEQETLNLVEETFVEHKTEYTRHINGDKSYFGFFMKKCMEKYPHRINYDVLKKLMKNKLFKKD